MKTSDKVVFGVVLLFFVSIVGLSTYGQFFQSQHTSLSYKTSVSSPSLLTGAVTGLQSITVASSVSDVVECWSFSSQTACNNNGSLGCKWNSVGSYCERWGCFNADGTNQTFCETTLKTSFNQSCTWSVGTSTCNPIGGGFFGSKCADYNGNANGCYNTFFCNWNSSSSLCNDPVGGFASQTGANNNPGCQVITNQKICAGISGCSWDSGFSICTGNTGGMSCSLLNKTMCPDFTLFSSCCNWNGTNCSTSFDKGCYSKVPSLPAGATFCEDYNAFSSQTLCNQISTTPYYLPCKWDNVTNQCHFNSAGFGGTASGSGGGAGGKFSEMSTETGCKSSGGTWKTQQFTDGSGSVKSDTFCEFNFGFKGGMASGGGNCDSACWACEAGVSKTKGNSSSQAQSFCQNSALGYCDYRGDSNAPNGLGWCNPKQSFVDGGAKSCTDECGACESTNIPQAKCQNSTRGCAWVADTNAPNGVGYCYGKSEKYCGNDCFSCYDSNTCTFTGKGGAGACTWDVAGIFCKPTGFTGEVCFDGKDNDNNGLIDCKDPTCSTDKFCGGEALAKGFNTDCPSFTSNATCSSNKCQWAKSSFEDNFGGASAGHCDFPGAQCGIVNDQSSCQNTSGCNWNGLSSNTCGQNSSLFNSCFPQSTQGNCENIAGCGWSTDHFNTSRGRCEPMVFSQCFGNETRFSNQVSCEQNTTVKSLSTQVCSWTIDPFSPNGGRCNPICFSRAGAAVDCQGSSRGVCQLTTGYCSPKSFGGGCVNANGNKTRCQSEFNATCQFYDDSAAGNGNTTETGWCKSKGEVKMFNLMGDTPPTILGSDGADAVINDYWDINNVGLRDDPSNMVFGTNIVNFDQSAACNGKVLVNRSIGAGIQNYTFFWYVDTDGNTTNHCVARDNSSIAGFEFSFKYQVQWGAALTEGLASFQCVNGSWGPVPVPLFSVPQKMCALIQGGMAGVSKKDLYKFKDLYNKSKNLRLYATVGDAVSIVNESRVNDTVGPLFYSPGSIDVKFEDCSNSGGDADGDGLTASNDPDCQMYNKFGYVPSETGFQCGDNQDNDGDGLTDCGDDGCKAEPVCGGSGVVARDAADKTAPKITWLQMDTFPDGASVTFDTNEPANGTVSFYGLNTTCSALNKTILDYGLIDPIVPDYRVWHDAPIDNMNFNVQKVGYLANDTTYFYKMTVCDINANCAVSACLNFTTKALLSSCKSCASTFTFPFAPPSGAGVTNPMGNLSFKFTLADGTQTLLGANAGSGSQLNYTASRNFNLVVENPSAPNVSKWRVTFINASISGKISTDVQNFTGGSDIQFNATSNGTFIGLSSSKCQSLVNALRPKRLELGVPGNITTQLWQCSSGALGNCTNRASNATLVGFNVTLNMTLWQVPSEWGC